MEKKISRVLVLLLMFCNVFSGLSVDLAQATQTGSGANSTTVTRYEAESAKFNHVLLNWRQSVSGGQYIGTIDYDDSYVDFTVSVPNDGYYPVKIGYATTQSSSHTLIVNYKTSQQVNYTSTGGWGVMGTTDTAVYLNKGLNSLKFIKSNYYSELDYIEVDSQGSTVNTIKDDFKDGNSLGWGLFGGQSSVTNSAFVITPGAGKDSKAILLEKNFKDFSISADMAILGDAGFLLRATDVKSGLDLCNAYYVGLKLDGGGKVVVGYENNGSYTELYSYNCSINRSISHNLDVKISGNLLTIKVDNNTIASNVQLSSTSKVAGAIGLRTYNTAAGFTNVKITEDNIANQLNYNKNIGDLTDNPFIPLKLGAVKPKGWLLTQMNLQKDGFTGHSEELYNNTDELGSQSAWLTGNTSATISEKGPYYLKGMIPLAYILDDNGLKAKIAKWVDYTVGSQLASGNFGPTNLLNDYWSKMPMLYALKDYYEATNDPRVISLLTKYFNYQYTDLSNDPNSNKLVQWAKARGADNIDVVLWLYNKTGDTQLVDLAKIIKTKMYDWTTIFTDNTFNSFQTADNTYDTFYPKHAVNVAQAFKAPAIEYQFTKSQADKNAFVAGRTNVLREHGQPSGMQSGDEMLGGLASTAGMETCAVVEQMQSNEEAQMILGDASIGDQLEQIAFNALPACFTKDVREHEYYTIANQVVSDQGLAGYDVDYWFSTVMSPVSGMGCCRFNANMGWPYFVKNLWAATNDGGLGVIAYAPSTVTSYVGDNKLVTIDETTDYPFKNTVNMDIKAAEPATFPLKLRIPAWCSNPSITVNGIAQTGIVSGEYYTINRTWNNNDSVVITFPMELKAKTGVNNSAYIMRGPLVYSLKLNQNANVITDYSTTNPNLAGFKDILMSTDSKWNVALELDRNNPSNSITVNESATMPSNPFELSTTPVTLTATAKEISTWGLSPNGRYAEEVPYSPVASQSAAQTVTLVPYGAEVLRVTEFPVVEAGNISVADFADDFNNNTMTDWLSVGGSSNAINGSLNTNWIEGDGGGKTTKVYVPKSQMINFDYDLDIKVANSGDAGAMFRVSNVNKGGNSFKGYYAGLSAEKDQVILGRCDGTSWTPILLVSKPINAKTSYHVRIRAIGSNIKVFFNNESTSCIDVTDNSYSSGSIGVRTYTSDASFDNISVQSRYARSPR